MLVLKHRYLSINAKDGSGKDLLLTLTIGFMAFVAAANLIMRTSYHGLLSGVDTVDYLSTAENLTSGEGFRTYSYYSSLDTPPLYSLLLAVLNILGMSVRDASKAINIVALGLIIILTGHWLSRHVKSRLLIAGTIAIIVASHIMNSLALFAMTETLFILLILLALLQLDTFLNQRNSMGVLSLSALLGVLASLTRWTGISVIFTTIILIMINKSISIKGKVRYITIYGTITLIPFLIYWAYSLIGYATLGSSSIAQLRPLAFVSSDYLWSIVETLYGWLFVPELDNIHALTIDSIEIEPRVSPFNRAIILLWIMVIVIMLITLIFNRNNDTYKKKFQSEAVPHEPQTSMRLILLFGTYILIYLMTLNASAVYLSTYNITLNILYRFFSPIYAPILMCTVLIFERFFRLKFRDMRPVLLKFMLVALIAFGYMVHINSITQWNISLTAKTLEYNNYNPYIRSYTPNSPIIEYLNDNRLEGDVFVSYIPILYRLTNVTPPVRPINCSDQFNQFTDSTPSHKEKVLNPVYIILFTKVPDYGNCSLQDLALQNPHIGLIVETSELIVETSDGLIYKINSANQT